ncbi:hypothetical protein MTR_8g469560 [Medicago truncatula]|uniref:Uncharacterized protein n=1 Tax=Medicago truncatula TaxID=3880 RepID=A0A072TRS6_MEDTR|nr:hypothetical protein MTR_8g469560 [Medicago truncatula]
MSLITPKDSKCEKLLRGSFVDNCGPTRLEGSVPASCQVIVWVLILELTNIIIISSSDSSSIEGQYETGLAREHGIHWLVTAKIVAHQKKVHQITDVSI